MADGSNIEWTDATWNPVVGCAKVAQGCKHCYAERMAKRLARMGQDHYAAVVNDTGWNGRAVTVPEALSKPLRWKKPRRIFVNSMSDLFHEAVPFEFIAAVYGVMAACPQHLFIILTKRPRRMREFMEWWAASVERAGMGQIALGEMGWPLPHVIHGYSASTQADIDAGMPDLMQVPSASHMLSAEPLLGDLDLGPALEGLDWVVVGGESGPGARPCDVAWIRSIVAQCKAAGVPCFVKQLGAKPFEEKAYQTPGSFDVWCSEFMLKDRKGGNPAEWPADLRVRQFPQTSNSREL